MSEKKSNPQEEMNKLLRFYLENTIKIPNPELEVRFGTRGIKGITYINNENVSKKLLASGFDIRGGESYKLRIQNEYIHRESGETNLSNVRTEIEGLYNIQKALNPSIN